MSRQCYNTLQDFLALAAEFRLVGDLEAQQFNHIIQDRFNQYQQFFQTYHYPPQVLLAESDPLQFLGSFIAGVAANCPIFLGNPHWKAIEWQQVFLQVQPDIILGQVSLTPPTIYHSNLHNLAGLIMIPTGGTSGQIKFVVHTWETLTASAQGFQQYFQCNSVNSYCVLPLYHVSGLMQFIRSFTSKGQLMIQSFNQVKLGNFIEIHPSSFFISLVPTQLQSLLQSPQTVQWLSQFHTVLLGGAPAWLELLETARLSKIRLAPTYGMTETASQIATLKPDEFLAGYQNSGHILPHAKIRISEADSEDLRSHKTGTLTIESKSLMWGYYHSKFNPANRIKQFNSDDLGYIDEQGYLTILGRNSDKIITGGEKVFPAEVEAVIRGTGKVKDVCIIGLPDSYWGQVVTAVYTPLTPEINLEILKKSLTDKLSKYKHPKLWIPIETIPYNAQGKVNRKTLQVWIESLKNG